MKNKKPNFLIIGAMKAATTSLYSYLKQHPDIFFPSIKEPMFFNNLHNKKYIIKGVNKKKRIDFDDYYNLFKDVKNEKSIGEASPIYLYNKNCPELIKKHLPETKIIVILRQPVERAYSNYLHAKKSGREPLNNFEDAIKEESSRIKNNWSPLYHYKNQGYYFKQLSRYYKLFKSENIKIILFEDLTNNPICTTQEIFKFLKINHNFISKTNTKENIGGIPKGILGFILMKMRYYDIMPNIEFKKYLPKALLSIIISFSYSKPKKINKELVKKLTKKHYKDDILKLQKLIKKDLKNWLN